MKFLADENVPLRSAELISESGHDVLHVISVQQGISDKEVMKLALKENRILITFDRDFGEEVFKNNVLGCAGVILLRFSPSFPEEAYEIINDVISNPEISLSGMFTVIERDYIRQRKLP